MTDNADIRRVFEQVSQQNHQLRRRVEKLERTPADLRNAAIDGGRGLTIKSDAETIRFGDNGVEHVEGPDPERPEAPFVDTGGEAVKIQLSGLDAYGYPAQRNFKQAHIHVSQDDVFEPSRGTFAGYVAQADGSMTHRLPGGEWYVGVVWENMAGVLSPMSETTLADVAPLVDADEIQEALDEAAGRLAEAEQDFQEGNEARKQEIENLRDNVIPGLRESLNDKADQSALDDLDDKLDNIDIPDLSGVPTKDQVDEAVKAAEQAAKEHADLVSKGAKDDAIAEAEAKADAAKEAAETAAKDYTDQAKADAAADAQEKADAAREHADKLVGELDFSDFAHVWRQDDPPPAGTTYEWTDGAHASPSVKRVGGEETARNLVPSPWRIDSSYSTSNVEIEQADNDSLNLVTTTGGGTSYTGKTRFDVEPGQWFASAASFEWGEGIGRVRHQVQFRGPDNESIDAPQQQSDRSDHPDGGRTTAAWEVPDGAVEARLYTWYYLEGTFTTAPAGSTIYVGEYSVAVAATEEEALAQVETYFDGDTPDEREKDLWIDKAGLPHFWKKGWGWAVLDDERISKALNDADKAQKTADEAHSEAGEAKDQADAAMDRAGAAEDYADGLPKVLHGTSAPSGTAPDGSVWFQHQDSLSGAVVGQWNMTDGSWQSTPIDSEAIANLDVGKLTAGSADLAEAVVGKIWGQLGVFDRLDAREGWVGGVALEDGAVGAEQVNVEELFSDEAVINKVWSDIVRARMLTAEEALIGGAIIKDNTIDVAKLNVTEQLTAAVAQFLRVKADMLEANAIDADKIASGAIETDHLNGRIIKGENIQGDTFSGESFEGGTFTGSTFQTDSLPNHGLKFSADGIHGWDDNGEKTLQITGEISEDMKDPDAGNFLTGRFYTNGKDLPGIILNPDYGPDSHQGPGVWFSEDGWVDASQPAIWVNKSDFYNLTIRGKRWDNGSRSHVELQGGINVTEGGVIVDNGTVQSDYGSFRRIEASGQADFRSTSYFHGTMRYPGKLERTGSSNVQIYSSHDNFAKITSVRASKVNIEDVKRNRPERILDLQPRIWLDRTDLKEALGDDYSNYVWAGNQYSGPTVDEEKLKDKLGYVPRRIPGLVAEEVVAAGLDEYAIYDEEEDGTETLQSISYDRLWTLLIPLVREHRDKLAAQEERITALEQQNADLEERLARLEAIIDA